MHNHPSAGMVYEAVSAEYQNISRATVFRILAEAADEDEIDDDLFPEESFDDEFDDFDEASEGLRWAQLPGGRGGYIDNTGAWAVPPRYTFGCHFTEGFAFVHNDKGYLGVVDAKGKVVVPFRYKEHILSKIESDRIEMVTYHYYYPKSGTFIDNSFDAVLYENRQLSLQEGW